MNIGQNINVRRMYMYPTPAPVIGQNPFENNIIAVKKFFARPMILIYAILYTVTSAISLYVTYQTSKSSFMISVNGQQSTTVTLIVSAFISLVFCFALFYIYIRSKNPDPSALPNAGFTILQIFAIFMVVIFSICVAVLLFAGIIVGFVGIGDLGLYWDDIVSQIPQFSQYDSYMLNGEAFVTALTIAIFIIATVAAIILTYYIAALRFVASAKSNMRNLTMRVKGSTYFGVLTLIVAIFSTLGVVISCLGSGFMDASMSSMGSMYGGANSLMGGGSPILSKVLSILELICSYMLAIIALSYSGHIKRNAGAVTYAMPAAVNAVPFVAMPAGQYANPYAAVPTAPVAMPGAPVAMPTAPAAMPGAPVAMPTAPAAMPTAPVAVPGMPATPVAPVEAPAAPVEAPVAPVETPAAPVEIPAAPVEAPAAAEESVEPVQNNYGLTQEPYMTQAKTCPNCGASIEAGSSFCIDCGTRL